MDRQQAQVFQFEQEKDDSYIIFHVCQVLETTNLELKPFTL